MAKNPKELVAVRRTPAKKKITKKKSPPVMVIKNGSRSMSLNCGDSIYVDGGRICVGEPTDRDGCDCVIPLDHRGVGHCLKQKKGSYELLKFIAEEMGYTITKNK